MRLVALALLSGSCSLVLDFDDGDPPVDAAVDATSDATSDASDARVDGDIRDAFDDAPTPDAADVGVLDARSDVGEGDAAEEDAGMSCAMACTGPVCGSEELSFDGIAVEMSHMVTLNLVSICYRECTADAPLICSDATFVGDASTSDYRWSVSVALASGCAQFQLVAESATVNTCALEVGE